MTLPSSFSPAEHFQDVARRIYNDEVRDHFRDLNTDELDIASPRSSIRTACTHQEQDSLLLTLGRMALYDMVIGQRWRLLASATGGGVPSANAIRRNKPKVTLYFREDDEDVDPDFGPVAGEVSFRIMDQAANELTESELTLLGSRIKTQFNSETAQIWKKGRYSASYSDWDKGYQLQLLVKDKNEAKDLVGRVLGIRNHIPDWENFNFSENEAPHEAFPYNPPNQTVLGKSRKIKRRRPITNVRLQYADCWIPGLVHGVIIFDRSGAYPDALVKS